jgi:predicted N-acetyltransferase YhbS
VSLGLRPGTPDDVQACAAICYAAFGAIAGRHGFASDFPAPELAEQLIAALLARGDVYAVVAETEGRVVGSNFLWETAPIVGVGPITVDPAVQDRAVGRRLMEDVLERARARRVAGVRLVQAAYHNRSLSLLRQARLRRPRASGDLAGPGPQPRSPGPCRPLCP